MANAILFITPTPDSDLGPDSFRIRVMPDPGGLDIGEGVAVSDEAGLLELLSEITEPEAASTWAEMARKREPFAIESTYEEWRRLQSKAEAAEGD